MKCSLKICARNQSDGQIAERTSIVRYGLDTLLLSEGPIEPNFPGMVRALKGYGE